MQRGLAALELQLVDANAMVNLAEEHIEKFFQQVLKVVGNDPDKDGACSLLEDYRLYCVRERAIYSAMNLLKISKLSTTYKGLLWIEKDRPMEVQKALYKTTVENNTIPIGQIYFVD